MKKVWKSLATVQDDTVYELGEARSSPARKAKYDAAVLRRYRAYAAKCGYNKEQVDGQVRDIRDIAALRYADAA